MIHKHVIQMMNLRVKLFFKDVIFRFKIRRSIKKRNEAAHKVLLYLFSNSLAKKIKFHLMVLRRSIRKLGFILSLTAKKSKKIHILWWRIIFFYINFSSLIWGCLTAFKSSQCGQWSKCHGRSHKSASNGTYICLMCSK